MLKSNIERNRRLSSSSSSSSFDSQSILVTMRRICRVEYLETNIRMCTYL